MRRMWNRWRARASRTSPALKGWRRELFGDKALKLKSGKLALAASPKGVKIIEL